MSSALLPPPPPHQLRTLAEMAAALESGVALLDAELAEGDITRRGYEKRLRVLLDAYARDLATVDDNHSDPALTTSAADTMRERTQWAIGEIDAGRVQSVVEAVRAGAMRDLPPPPTEQDASALAAAVLTESPRGASPTSHAPSATLDTEPDEPPPPPPPRAWSRRGSGVSAGSSGTPAAPMGPRQPNFLPRAARSRTPLASPGSDTFPPVRRASVKSYVSDSPFPRPSSRGTSSTYTPDQPVQGSSYFPAYNSAQNTASPLQFSHQRDMSLDSMRPSMSMMGSSQVGVVPPRGALRDHRPYSIYDDANTLPGTPAAFMPMGAAPSVPQLLHPWAGLQSLPQAPRPMPVDLYDRATNTPMSTFETIAHLLRHRATFDAKGPAFTCLDAKGKETGSLTWEKLLIRADRLAQQLRTRLNTAPKGVKVGLVYRRSEILDYVVAFYACLLNAMVPVPIVYMDSLAEMTFILTSTKAHFVLSTDANIKALAKDLADAKRAWPAGVEWVKTNDSPPHFERRRKNEEPLAVRAVDLAYLEFSKNFAGEVKGVGVPHRTVLSQCAALKYALHGNKAAPDTLPDVLVTCIEPRQQFGCIVAVLFTVYAGYHTVFLPSAALETPGLWVNTLSRYRASMAMADYAGMQSVLSSFRRDPTATVMFNKKQPPDLMPLKQLLIDTILPDSSLDKDIEEALLLQLGCRHAADVVTPVCSLAEHGGMILAMRDVVYSTSGRPDVPLVVHLDRRALQCDIIDIVPLDDPRVNDRKVTLKLASFGYPMPQATVTIVDPETKALCPPGTVGEIWVDSPALSGGFWALPKHTQSIFRAKPIKYSTDQPGLIEQLTQEFLRTGLIGTLINGRLVVFGVYEDRIRQSLPASDDPSTPTTMIHYGTDIAYNIMSFVVNVSACTAFDILLGGQYHVVIVCESPARVEEHSAVAERLLSVLAEYHGIVPYAVLLCLPNSIPRSIKNGRRVINTEQCRRAFETGRLSVTYTSLLSKRAMQSMPSAATALPNGVNQEVHLFGNRPQLCIQPPIQLNAEDVALTGFSNIVDVLIWRCSNAPDASCFTQIDAKGREVQTTSFRKFNQHVANIAAFLTEKKSVRASERILVVLPHGTDFAAATFACMVLGAVPIPLAPPDAQRLHEDLPALLSLVQDLGVRHVVCNETTETMLRGKPVQSLLESAARERQPSSLPPVINIDRVVARKVPMLGTPSAARMEPRWCTPNYTALILVHFNPDLRRCCVQLTHADLMAQCILLKSELFLLNARPLISCVRTYNGFGFVHGNVLGVYVGCPTLMLPPTEFAVNPRILFDLVCRLRIKDVFATFPMISHAMAYMASSDYMDFTLQHMRALLLIHEGRIPSDAYDRLAAFFLTNRLESTAISTFYSPVVNPLVASRAYRQALPQKLKLCPKQLRCGRVFVLHETNASPGILLQDSGKCSRGCHVAIVNPITRQLCAPAEVGEIWIGSASNVSGFIGPESVANEATFGVRLPSLDPALVFARTGDLGFLWPDLTHPDQDPFLYYLGAMDDTIDVAGLSHFITDLEATVERAHPNVVRDGCVVFKHADQVYITVQAQAALEVQLYAMIPVLVNAIIEEHQFVPDVIVFVSEHGMRKSRIGEKQRDRIRFGIVTSSIKPLLTYTLPS